MKTTVRIIGAMFLASLLGTSAMAQPRWSNPYRNNLPPGLAKRNGNLPPGLQKHVYRTGHLPPGLEKRFGTWGYYKQPKHFKNWDRDRAWDRDDWRGKGRSKPWKY